MLWCLFDKENHWKIICNVHVIPRGFHAVATINSTISQCHFHCITVSSCSPSRGSSYMALSVGFDMQRTTELRTADSPLENTFQPASDCVTANQSRREASAISTTKSCSLSALMWTCTTVKKNMNNKKESLWDGCTELYCHECALNCQNKICCCANCHSCMMKITHFNQWGLENKQSNLCYILLHWLLLSRFDTIVFINVLTL